MKNGWPFGFSNKPKQAALKHTHTHTKKPFRWLAERRTKKKTKTTSTSTPPTLAVRTVLGILDMGKSSLGVLLGFPYLDTYPNRHSTCLTTLGWHSWQLSCHGQEQGHNDHRTAAVKKTAPLRGPWCRFVPPFKRDTKTGDPIFDNPHWFWWLWCNSDAAPILWRASLTLSMGRMFLNMFKRELKGI